MLLDAHQATSACFSLTTMSFETEAPRVCQSSLDAEAQSEALDALEFVVLFVQELKELLGVIMRHLHEVLVGLSGFLVIDCTCLYDALERSETNGIHLSEQKDIDRSSEQLSTEPTVGLENYLANYDRTLAETHTKDKMPMRLIRARSRGRTVTFHVQPYPPNSEPSEHFF